MYCPTCGSQVEERAKFCRSCGRDLTKTTAVDSGGVSIGVQQRGAVQTYDTQRPRGEYPSGGKDKKTCKLPRLPLKLIGGIAGIAIVALLAFILLGRMFGSTSIVGKWASDRGEVLTFNRQGNCSVPFTYDGSWLESCDNYVVQDDGTLILSSSRGNLRPRSFDQTASKEQALEDDDLYYLDRKELVIEETLYNRK